MNILLEALIKIFDGEMSEYDMDFFHIILNNKSPAISKE